MALRFDVIFVVVVGLGTNMQVKSINTPLQPAISTRTTTSGMAPESITPVSNSTTNGSQPINVHLKNTFNITNLKNNNVSNLNPSASLSIQSVSLNPSTSTCIVGPSCSNTLTVHGSMFSNMVNTRLKQQSMTSTITPTSTITSGLVSSLNSKQVSPTGYSHLTAGLVNSHLSKLQNISSPTQTPAVPNVKPTISSTFNTSLATTLVTSSSLIGSQPTPGQPVIVKPPPLPAAITTYTTASSPCGVDSCCTYALNQLPALLVFDESTQAGSELVAMRDVYNVSLSVKFKQPVELISLFQGYFNITNNDDDYLLILEKEVDLEGLYKRAGETIDVHIFQLQITCVDHIFTSVAVPPRLLNVTIDDVDDNMPVFNHPGHGNKGCEVPVYKAETSEDFMGELDVSPRRIRAVDGDLSTRHNISYHVMHSEPDDYHVYFDIDEETGLINKTREMNSSDPNKYVIFIQAIEDSPQQKSRVAILSIVVIAPDPPLDISNVDPVAKLTVQIVCVLVLMGLSCGILVVIHHRYTLAHRKQVHSSYSQDDEERDVRLPKLAVYTSSNSSLNSAMADVPTINSPSQVKLDEPPKKQWLELPPRYVEPYKKRRVVVKKPLDTNARPSWNAPTPRPKRNSYNPFEPYKNARIK
ncbi:long-chain fatty acid transporter fat1 [Mactra antiquata]